MDEIDLDLPPVEERLAALRPSRQLLEFYRRKTDELEAEHDKGRIVFLLSFGLRFSV